MTDDGFAACDFPCEIFHSLALSFACERGFNSILKHNARREVFDLKKVFRRAIKRSLRHESNDLAA